MAAPFGVGPLALGCFGPDHPDHALRQAPLYAGFTPHESLTMRGLAHMPAGDPAKRSPPPVNPLPPAGAYEAAIGSFG